MSRRSRATRHGPPHRPPAVARRVRWRSRRVVLLLVVVAAGVAVAGWVASRPRTPVPLTLGEAVPDEGFDHVAVGAPVRYRSHPPASGPHYPTPAPAGVYPQGLPPGFWVHNLEHGYIVLVYRPPVPTAVLDEFHTMERSFPPSKFGNVKLVVAPYADMPHPFAVLAWNWRLWMDSLDPARVLAFYRAHVDHGREDVP